jgi:glycosyltransferase involved in cell wall biosynthesis
MPAFDGEAFVTEAIESVLSQTLDDLELVLVDDGSRDGSRSILERYARADPRVRLIANRENSGISAAANEGCESAEAR